MSTARVALGRPSDGPHAAERAFDAIRELSTVFAQRELSATCRRHVASLLAASRQVAGVAFHILDILLNDPSLSWGNPDYLPEGAANELTALCRDFAIHQRRLRNADLCVLDALDHDLAVEARRICVAEERGELRSMDRIITEFSSRLKGVVPPPALIHLIDACDGLWNDGRHLEVQLLVLGSVPGSAARALTTFCELVVKAHTVLRTFAASREISEL